MANSALATEASKEAQEVILDRVPYIYSPLQLQKDKKATIRALIDSDSKLNAITPAYSKQLGLQVRETNVGA